MNPQLVWKPMKILWVILHPMSIYTHHEHQEEQRDLQLLDMMIFYGQQVQQKQSSDQ
jgi:hypothetical protein